MSFPLLPLAEVLRLMLLLVRLSAMVMTLPFFSSRAVPGHLKLVFIGALGLSLYPLARTQTLVLPRGFLHLGLLLLGELLIGMLIGFVAQVMFAGVQLGGALMDQQMGLNLANLLDPQHGQQITIIANFQYVLVIFLFFATQAHHWFILAMAESLHAIPLLGFTLSQTVLQPLVALLGKAFVMAIQIAAPVMVTLLLANMGMGIVSRLVPQMNIFILSLPVNLGVGLVVLSVSLPYLLGRFRGLLGQLGRDLLLLIRLLGGS